MVCDATVQRSYKITTTITQQKPRYHCTMLATMLSRGRQMIATLRARLSVWPTTQNRPEQKSTEPLPNLKSVVFIYSLQRKHLSYVCHKILQLHYFNTKSKVDVTTLL